VPPRCAVAAVNLSAPPPIFYDQRAAADKNAYLDYRDLSARRRCHFGVFIFIFE